MTAERENELQSISRMLIYLRSEMIDNNVPEAVIHIEAALREIMTSVNKVEPSNVTEFPVIKDSTSNFT